MNDLLTNVLIVLVFVLIGGFFAAAELALVSLRDSQVRNLAGRSGRGRRIAKLHADPNRFLAAGQVGVTLAGFFSAAFGAEAFSSELAPVLVEWGLSADLAGTLALVVVTLVISYFSLVLGELVPKRLALQRAEGLSLAVAPVLDWLASLSRPAIWVLSRSTDLVVRALGGDPRAQREEITGEELRQLVIGHRDLGADERLLIDEVFDAVDRQLREVMLPRTEVDFLDATAEVADVIKVAIANPHSRYPVYLRSQDNVVGFVHVRDLFDPSLVGRVLRVGDLARDIKMLPATKRVLPALSEMRREGHHMAIVVDEYGGTAGIVTLEDLVEELIGDIRDEYDTEVAVAARRLRGGDFDVDGLLNLDDMADETGLELPEGPYETVAGYLVAQLGHLPAVGESVEVGRFRLTVTELDGRRVARVRCTELRPADGGNGEDPGVAVSTAGGEQAQPDQGE